MIRADAIEKTSCARAIVVGLQTQPPRIPLQRRDARRVGVENMFNKRLINSESRSLQGVIIYPLFVKLSSIAVAG